MGQAIGLEPITVPNTIRSTAAVLAFAACLSGPGWHVEPAQANPSSNTAVAHALTRHQAHSMAAFALHEFFVDALPKPHHGRVFRCAGGPRVWKCPVETIAPRNSCTAVMWIWGDLEGVPYYEWHRLRCETSPS
jgi:hypothetical protein